MRIRLLAIVFAAAITVAPSFAQTANQEKPPIEAFATLPTVSDPSLSPDGTHLALIQVYSGRPVATIWKLGEAKPQLILPYDDGFIVGATWKNDRCILITINVNARVYGDDVNPFFRTVAINIDSKQSVELFSNKRNERDYNYSTASIDDLAPNDPDHIYMPLYSGAGMVLGVYDEPRDNLFRVNVNTGDAEIVEKGGAHTAEWIMDGSGNIVARLDQTKDPLVDHILAYTPDKSWKEIASADATEGNGFSIYGVSSDGRSLILNSASKTTGIQGLVAMSLETGKTHDLYFDPLFDVADSLNDPWTRRVVGVALTMHLTTDTYFDPSLQEMQKAIEAPFAGTAVHALSWDMQRNKIVFSVDGPNTPTTFYLFDRSTNQFHRVGRTYPQLQISDLGRVRVYNYTARDGLEIPAYLTLPPGKDPKNLPVVILPHGGPMARDDMSFDWESQFLANRGYAVLRPNFRGSSGYGLKFMEAGYGQWGLKMQDDVTDGVKKLIADGIADPKRICIVGGSYGGYAALAGAAFTPDLYACAAAWAPVSNLRQFLATRSHDYGRDSEMISSWQHFIGNRWDDSEKLDAASPSENAAKIKVPVLLMHGEADATVRIDQSKEMDSALRHAHKKVTFIRIEKETHYMQTSASRIRWLTELEKFLKENIGN